jgi:hypothetical protein
MRRRPSDFAREPTSTKNIQEQPQWSERWHARFCHDGKQTHIGSFGTIEPAFIAYYLTKKALQRECRIQNPARG